MGEAYQMSLELFTNTQNPFWYVLLMCFIE